MDRQGTTSTLGILSLVGALLLFFYGWFAAGWDGGTPRESGDRVVMGLAVLIVIGSGAMIAGRRNGGWLAGGGWLLALALLTLS